MTSQTTPKTVDLSGDGVAQEAEALGTITPGMLIERATSGSTFGVQAHSSQGETGNLHFAVEYDLTGRGISDDYSSGDQVKFKTFYPGAHVYALLADGENVSAGDHLVSDGAGALDARTVDEVIIAQALEDVDNSAGGAVARIKVEVFAPQRFAPTT